MEKDVLKIIKDELNILGITYEYGEFTGSITYPYGVGEFSEHGYTYEDNATGGEMVLTFFNRGSELDLINIKELIKNKFRDYKKTTDSGAVYIAYSHKLFIPSGEANLRKMEIYLTIKYWEGA